MAKIQIKSEKLTPFGGMFSKPKGRFFWLPLTKYIKHPILPQTKRTVPLVRLGMSLESRDCQKLHDFFGMLSFN